MSNQSALPIPSLYYRLSVNGCSVSLINIHQFFYSGKYEFPLTEEKTMLKKPTISSNIFQ